MVILGLVNKGGQLSCTVGGGGGGAERNLSELASCGHTLKLSLCINIIIII